MARSRLWVTLLCLVTTLLFVGEVLAQQRPNRARRARWPWKGPDIGTVIKDFELPTLDGKKFRLSDYRGKIVVIELGACT